MNKKISNVCIILVMLFSINTFSQTNTNTLEDMCLGTLAIAPDLPISAFQKYTIPVTSTNSGKTNYKSVKISFNNNDGYTVMYFETTPGSYFVVGYAPVIYKGYTMGLGQFVAYKKTNGQISNIINYTGGLSEVNENGQKVQYLESKEDHISVRIINVNQVTFMIFNGFGHSFPENYTSF